jgi:hypothetical protein
MLGFKMASKMARFPDLPTVSVTKSYVYIFENGALESRQDLEELLALMHEFPEREFTVYFEKGVPLNHWILSAEHNRALLFSPIKFSFYRHPNSKRDYIHIDPDDCEFDWEREAIKKGPMFLEVKLKLSDTERQRRNSKDVTAKPSPLFFFKPSVWGTGIDLAVATQRLRASRFGQWVTQLMARRAGRS